MNDDTNRKTDPEILAEQPVPELDSDRINKRKSKKIERQEQVEKYAKKRKKSRRRHRALITFLTLLIGAAIGITTVYAATVLCAKKTADDPTQESATVVSTHPNAELALKLLKDQPEVENTILSPLSIEYTLAMLRDGAAENSETRQQIENLIGNRELPQYENIKKHISFANAIWIKEDFKSKIKSEFVTHLADTYGAEVRYDTFASTKNINKWVAERTFNMIDKVFDQLDSGAKIVLANTIAIDILWEQEFRALDTSGQGFHLHKDDKDYHKDSDKANYVATTLNHGCGATIDENGCDIKYAFLKDTTIFTKTLQKYGNSELEFVAVMPNDLKKYVNNLTVDRLNADVSAAAEPKVDSDQYNLSIDYYLPRFSYKGGIDNFSKELYDLGITDAFDDEKAKFTNIYESSIPQDNLYVLDAAHKTFIGLDERGIRAAAITAVVGGMGAGGPHYLESHADLTISLNRPFLYLIRDKNTKDIWFIGTVYKPNKWENDCSAYGNDCSDEEYDDEDYDDEEDNEDEDED